jgi:hypothetical protein
VAAFFLPGPPRDGRATEEAYGEIRRVVEVDTGLRPTRRRISQLWSRRGGFDCLTEVGSPDPVHGGTVVAIFDMGPHQPFVVQRQSPAGALDGIREVLSSHAYSVDEFDS